MRIRGASAAILLAVVAGMAPAAAVAQSLNLDFGSSGSGPPATYGAAGRPGVWNSIPAAHGTTTPGLLDLSGAPTGVSVTQIGGLALLDVSDPSVTGDDALLLDDFLVTYDGGLESCIFLNGLLPGTYEVLIYARMPDPAVESYTSVDQEAGTPHLSVGGAWAGQHAELISFSRHTAVVPAGGDLDLHSGIVPGADPALGAALNGLQVRRLDLFADGFESGDTSAWSVALP
jgi:hypothetical protein